MATPHPTRSTVQQSDGRLRLRAFGGLSVLAAAGEPMHDVAALRRPAAVLVAVAAARDRGITRDKLLGLLWPDSNPERARHSLTQAIYAARRASGVDDLFVTGGALRLNRERMSSDIEEFEQALDAGDLETAVGLYAGPFLDGFFVADCAEFEQWVSARRSRFEDLAVAALDQLAERAARNGDVRRTIEMRRRLVSLRPLDTTAVVGLVSALARAGDRAGAVQRAQEHAAALKEQLDLDPDPSFVEMIEGLRETPATAEPVVVQPLTHLGGASDPAPDSVVPQGPGPNDAAPPAAKKRARWLRGPRLWMAAATTVAVVAAAGTALRPRAVRSEIPLTVAPRAARIFVAPFNVAGAASPVAYLGRGIADLLAARFSGDAGERALDAGTVATAWRRAGFDRARDVPRDSILRVARGQGADRVIVGSIVGDRSRTIVTATTLSASGDVVATAAVEGSADSISRMATRLAAKLVVAEAGEDTLLATQWDTPIPALRAFLRGRSAYRRADYLAAAHEFETAYQIDSTFAVAELQLARVADRIGDLETEDAALARVWPYRFAFEARERAQLVALAGPEYPRPTGEAAQLAAWATLVRTSPSRAGSWYELGARLARDGRRLGVDGASEQALVALNRALVIDPGYEPARDLLAQVAIRAGGRAAARTAIDSASSLGSFLEWRAAVERRDSSALADLRSRLDSMSRESLRAIAMASQFDAVGLRDGELAVRVLAQRATTPAQRVEAALAGHSFALNAGRIAEALAFTNRLRDLRPDSHAYLRLRVLDALYGAGDAAAGTRAARELAVPVDSMFRELPLMRGRIASDACVLAQWRLARGDTTDARSTMALLRSPDLRRQDPLVTTTPGVCADLLDASLAVAAKRPDALAVVQRLDALVLTSAVAGNASEYAHIALSRMYAALGHPRRAMVALRKRTYMAGWPAYLGTTWADESRIAKTIGDAQRAVASSQRYGALRATVAGASPETSR